jgi:hypothetical protein
MPTTPNQPELVNRGTDFLIVKWESVTDAVSYEIEVIGPSVNLVLPASSPVTLTDTLIPKSNAIYTIRVRALKDSDSSNWSAPLITATLPPIPEPPKVLSLMIDTAVSVSWDLEANSKVPDIDLTFPISNIELSRIDDSGIITSIKSDLPLIFSFRDLNSSLGFNRYVVRWYSIMSLPSIPKNTSEWSSPSEINKQVFARLELPSEQVINNLRMQYMRGRYDTQRIRS